jgi:hypothetical protein
MSVAFLRALRSPSTFGVRYGEARAGAVSWGAVATRGARYKSGSGVTQDPMMRELTALPDIEVRSLYLSSCNCEWDLN